MFTIPVLFAWLGSTLLVAAVGAVEAPTWSGEIATVVEERCVSCHRPGGGAPMSFESFAQTRPWASSIARQVREGSMPPWHAAPGIGEFANERRLEASERAALLSWVAAGAPHGAANDLSDRSKRARASVDSVSSPSAGSIDSSWRIGEPDLVLELPQEVAIPASGEVPYHDYLVDPGFEEDVWVRAAESQPGNPDVVHHIIVGYVIEDPLVRRRLAREGHESRVQGSLGGYVPGDEPLVLPEGLARRIPAGAKIAFQMHYTPSGEPTTDRSRLGLVFAKEPPRHEVFTGIASNPFIHIPPGVASKSLSAEFTFPRDSRLLSMRPHLHLRGKSFEYRAEYPDGTSEVLLFVPDYDFGWQTRYVLAEPKLMPAGTKLVCTGTWDNSAANPENPDPSRTVSWGQQTNDEMMIGFFEYYEE